MINADLKVVFTYKITYAKSIFHGKTDRKLWVFAKGQQHPEIQTSLNPKYPNPAELKALKFEVCTEQLLPELRERIPASERKPERAKSDTFSWSPQLGTWAGAWTVEQCPKYQWTNGVPQNTQGKAKHLWVQLELTTNHLGWRWAKWQLS